MEGWTRDGAVWGGWGMLRSGCCLDLRKPSGPSAPSPDPQTLRVGVGDRWRRLVGRPGPPHTASPPPSQAGLTCFISSQRRSGGSALLPTGGKRGCAPTCLLRTYQIHTSSPHCKCMRRCFFYWRRQVSPKPSLIFYTAGIKKLRLIPTSPESQTIQHIFMSVLTGRLAGRCQ